MNINETLDLKNSFEEKGILLAFSGAISQPILSGFAKGMEFKLQNLGVENRTIRSIFEILIEMMQNILNYSYDSNLIKDSIYESDGIVTIGYNKEINKYFVLSGNRISFEQKEKISNQIDFLNQLSKEELRVLYKEKRKDRRDSHNRGAGLGLIDLARKSSEKIEYAFYDGHEKTLFFSLKVTI
jgi:hypothetical protein